MDRLRIYIAGPYTASDDLSVLKNVQRAIDAGIAVYKRGHYPYVPHLTHFVEERSIEIGARLLWEDYIHWDREWLQACDAILYLASSRGADLELAWAREQNKLVFCRVEEIPLVERLREPLEELVSQSAYSAGKSGESAP